MSAAAVLRFSRDKRGYEHFYLVQPAPGRRGRMRSRILYWFRTPPGVKVGRVPFDEEMRAAIEAKNPGVAFDWKKLLATPIPPPTADVERWRERRRALRAERAAKRAAAAETAEAAETTIDTSPEPDESEHSAAIQSDGSAPPAGPGDRPRKRRRRRRGRRRRGPAAAPTEGGLQASNETSRADEE